MLAGYREYLEQDVRFDDAEAQRLLARCGLRPPRLSSHVVHRLIDQALVTPEGRRPEAWVETA